MSGVIDNLNKQKGTKSIFNVDNSSEKKKVRLNTKRKKREAENGTSKKVEKKCNVKSVGGRKMTTIKSTVNLNKHYKEQLEDFVRMNMISSLTEGINDALEMYVKAMRKAMYAEQMRAAAHDDAFMERTLSSQRDFDAVDTGEMFTEDEQW